MSAPSLHRESTDSLILKVLLCLHVVPTPTLNLSVPSGLLYEGTSQILTCTASLPDTVDTDVNVTVQWIHNGTVMMSDVSSMRSPFISTLTLSPLSMTNAGQYSCVATADSPSHYITTSSQGQSSGVILNVTGISVFHGIIHMHRDSSFLQLCLLLMSLLHSLGTQLLVRTIL